MSVGRAERRTGERCLRAILAWLDRASGGMTRLVALLAAALAGALATSAPAAAPPPDATKVAELDGLRQADLRVASVAYRLATHASAWCAHTAPLAGLLVADRSLYAGAYRAAAAVLLHLDEGPAIAGVIAQTPAARAGIAAGDVLLAIDGRPVATIMGAAASDGSATNAADPDTSRKRASFDPTQRLLDAIAAAAARGSVRLELRRGGQQVTAAFDAAIGCASEVQLVPGRKLNAGADGMVVTLSTALLETAQSDDELAFILAHELSHNFLGHRVRLEDAGVSRGLLAGLGADARRIRRIEEEADYLAVYVMAAAGYDPRAAAAFWRRFDRAHGPGIFADATHLNGARRVRFLTLAADEVRAAQQAHRPLMPDIAGWFARFPEPGG